MLFQYYIGDKENLEAFPGRPYTIPLVRYHWSSNLPSWDSQIFSISLCQPWIKAYTGEAIYQSISEIPLEQLTSLVGAHHQKRQRQTKLSQQQYVIIINAWYYICSQPKGLQRKDLERLFKLLRKGLFHLQLSTRVEQRRGVTPVATRSQLCNFRHMLLFYIFWIARLHKFDLWVQVILKCYI